MANLSKERRDSLPDEDFGDPIHRAYPITDQEDVIHAASLLHHTRHPGGPEAVKKRIKQIIKRKGLEMPGTWQDDSKSAFAAEFSLDASATVANDDKYVTRKAEVIFRAGDYPDKNFKMTPEELAAAVAQFSPVEIDLEHKPTVLNGKLGKVTKVELSADGWTISGEARIPKWLDSELGADERKLSAAFDRNSKKLIGVSLVRTPRVSDASLMAAFAAFDAASGKMTKVGQDALKKLHDMAADKLGGCDKAKFDDGDDDDDDDDDESPMNDMSGMEVKKLKKIHKMASEGGKHCAAYKTGDSQESGNTYPDNRTLPTSRPGNPMPPAPPVAAGSIEGGPTYPENRDEGTIHDNNRLNASGKVQPAQSSGVLSTTMNPTPSTGSTPDTSSVVQNSASAPAADANAAQFAAQQAELAAAKAELAKAKQEQEIMRARTIAAEAVNFADAEIMANRALPAERDSLIQIYAQAAKDDSRSPDRVNFDGVSVTRVEALKRSQLKRPLVKLTTETLPVNGGAQAVFNAATTPGTAENGPMSEQRRKELLAATALGRSVIAK